jgi:splicing factor 3A subunit 3
MKKQVFNGFYSRLRELREYHKKFPNLHAEPELDTFNPNLDDDPDILSQFTGEEFFGRFLDLNPHHIKFINLKGTKAVTYEAYLSIFEDFTSVPEEVRTKKYRDYIKDLKDYLTSCVKRTQPLQDVEKMLEMSVEDFEDKWATKGPPPDPAPAALPASQTPLKRTIKLEVYGEWEELMSLGLETLKNELQGLGLKCGGTLDQRAQRLFATKGAQVVGDLDQSQLAGAAAAAKAAAKEAAKEAAKAKDKGPGEEEKKRKELRKEIGLLEHQVGELCDVLREVIEATLAQVQKKQSRTQEELAKEMENEMGDEEPESSSSEDEGEKPIYNPKKVPLDWTGKPIPYWLYKLHGLNLEYKCEICGNFSYWGPRAFERHFQEWRHAHGRCPDLRAVPAQSSLVCS